MKPNYFIYTSCYQVGGYSRFVVGCLLKVLSYGRPIIRTINTEFDLISYVRNSRNLDAQVGQIKQRFKYRVSFSLILFD